MFLGEKKAMAGALYVTLKPKLAPTVSNWLITWVNYIHFMPKTIAKSDKIRKTILYLLILFLRWYNHSRFRRATRFSSKQLFTRVTVIEDLYTITGILGILQRPCLRNAVTFHIYKKETYLTKKSRK